MTDKEEYTQGDMAKLTVTLLAPDAISHTLFTTQEDFQGVDANRVDANSIPGNLILDMNDQTYEYPPSGTLRLVVDAGSGCDWGSIEFTGGYPDESAFYDRSDNYLRSNLVRDVYFYDRSDEQGGWWENENASWYTEADDTVVDHALVTEEGWIVSVPVTTGLDYELDPNDFTIEGWISTAQADANAIMFYRGDDTDANYLCIYKHNNAIYVKSNVSGIDPNIRYVEVGAGDSWHYVALTVSDTTAKLYIDGNDVNDSWDYGVNVMAALQSTPLLIGGEPNLANPGNFLTVGCRIDEVSIYNRALDSSQIGQNYQNNWNHLPSEDTMDRIGYWSFNPGPQDKSRTNLGGMFTRAYLDDPNDYGSRQITGRSSDPNFPERSFIIATVGSIDIIDAENDSLWMRFLTDRNFLWDVNDARPSSVFVLDGKIYVGQNSHPAGLSIIDFEEDSVRVVKSDHMYQPSNPQPNIINRFATNVSFSQSGDLKLRSGWVNDVMAMTIGDVNYIAVGTRGGLTLIEGENGNYDSNSGDWVTNVSLTDSNDLYYVTTDPNGDTLHAVYDLLSNPIDDFSDDALYGYNQGEPSLLKNKINNLFVVSGSTVDSNNALYVATTKGLVRIDENQQVKSEGERKIYLTSQSNEPDDPNFVKILAGDSDSVTAICVDADSNELWVGTSQGLSTIGSLSIIDLNSDTLKASLTADSVPRLPIGTINALAPGLIGTSGGALMFEPSSVAGVPVSICVRSVYSDKWPDPNTAASEWTYWITESPQLIMDPNIIDPNSINKPGHSRMLELLVMLRRPQDRPDITPVLESICVGYTPDELAIDVTIEDVQGNEATPIDQIQIKDKHMGRLNVFERYFDTDKTQPGDYAARATLINSVTGAKLQTDVNDFTIINTSLSAVLDGSIVTDKPFYYGGVGEKARITSTVINKSASVVLDGLDVIVTVRKPNGDMLQTYSYYVDSLQPGDNDEKEFEFAVTADLSVESDYIVDQVVSLNGQDLEINKAEFDVRSSVSIQDISGIVTVSPTLVKAGNDVLDIAITASNIGNVDLSDVTLLVTVNSDHVDPCVIRTFEFCIPLMDIGSRFSFDFEYNPVGLEPNIYPVTLAAEFNYNGSDETRDLDISGFVIDDEVSSTAPDYIVIDLGSIDGNSFARAVNNQGNVTGYADVNNHVHAFYWKCGEMLDIHPLINDNNSIGVGINNFGQVVGYCYSTAYDTNSFIWENDDFNDIKTPDSCSVVASAINNQGQVTGYYTADVGGSRPFIWHKPSAADPYWDDLSDSGLFNADSWATGINDSGDLVGYWNGGRGFVRRKGVIINAGQYKSSTTYLQAINQHGKTAGYTSDNNVILYQDGIMMVLEEPLSDDTKAYGINNEGDVVGFYTEDGDSQACIWRDGVIYNLNDRLALCHNGGGGTSWDLREARAINNKGQIVGYGVIGGQEHAYRLDPLPFAVTEPNLILWLRADTGVVKDANGLVSKWIDQSCNGKDLEPYNPNCRPTWSSDMSCCDPEIHFDGNDDYLFAELGDKAHNGNSTIFMVVVTSTTNQETGALFASDDDNTESDAFEIKIAEPNLQLSTGAGTYSISPAAAEAVILEVVIGDTDVSFYKNGRLIGTAGLGANEARNYTHYVLGKSRNGDLLEYDVAEVLVFAGALSDTRRQQVEDYLIDKHRLYGPADIGQPELWYKADTGVTIADSNKVAIWADQSGDDNHAIQNDPCGRPSWQESVIECQPAIRFDGSVIEPNVVVGQIDTYLVMDASGTMEGLDEGNIPRIEYAREAAITYVHEILGGNPGEFQQSGSTNGLISIEAENYDDKVYCAYWNENNYWSLVTSPGGCSGGKAMQALPDSGYSHISDYTKESGRLDFRVNFVKTGIHYVWVLGYRTSDNDDSCHFGFAKEPVSIADKIQLSTPDSWAWTNSTEDGPRATFDVPSIGPNTINIWMYDDGFRIDKILLTTDGDYVPSGAGPAESPRSAMEPVKEHGHRVGLIKFAEDPNLVQALIDDPNLLREKINDLKPTTTTNFEDSIKLMTEKFNGDPNTIGRRVGIFLSDGHYNQPPGTNETRILNAVDEAAESGITLYTIAFGEANEDILEKMAQHGGGDFKEAEYSSELEGIFLEIYSEEIEKFSKQSLVFVFESGSDISTRQTLWALGDTQRGMNLYIDSNDLHFNVWNLKEDFEGEVPWGPEHISTQIEPNTAYFVEFVYDSNEGTIKGYLNGNESYFDNIYNISRLYPAKSEITIGSNPQKSLFHDGTETKDDHYVGHIAEILYYDKALSDVEREEIERYIAEKYGFEIEHNLPPIADADSDFTVIDYDWNGSATVELNGSACDDKEPDLCTYQWYEDGELIADGQDPNVGLDIGTHIIELVVTDEYGATSIDTLVVTVSPISSGLVVHWKFDETEGFTAEDSSGNNHDVNVVNASVPGCWRWGRVGGAVSFNAADSEYIELNPDGSNNVEYFPGGAHGRTIMGWFEAGDNRQPTFIDYGSDGPNTPNGRFAITASSDRLAVTIGSHIFGTENFCPVKGWHHIAVVFPDGAERSNQVKIFLDGEKQFLYALDDSVGPVTVNTSTWGDSVGYIGRDRNGNYFQGGIDDIRIYARGLRDSEITVFRTSEKTRYHVVDLGLSEQVENPQASEARAINNKGDIVGRNIIFLKPDTTYYWRVDERTDVCIIKSDIWEFTTDPNLN